MLNLSMSLAPRQNLKLKQILTHCCTECGGVLSKPSDMAVDEDIGALVPNSRKGYVYQTCPKCGRFYGRKQTYAERILREKLEAQAALTKQHANHTMPTPTTSAE